MSDTIPTIDQLNYFLAQLASARSALTPAVAAFNSAKTARDSAEAALVAVQNTAMTQFNGLIAGTVNPTAQDLQNSINAVATAMGSVDNARALYVTAQSAMVVAQTAFDKLVANARTQFAQVFGI